LILSEQYWVLTNKQYWVFFKLEHFMIINIACMIYYYAVHIFETIMNEFYLNYSLLVYSNTTDFIKVTYNCLVFFK
jgi:hypothetical protein